MNTVRIAQDNDIANVIELVKIHSEEGSSLPLDNDEAFRQVFESIIGGTKFWIAHRGSTPAGYARGHVIDDNKYRSDGIYTLPTHRNKGIGLLLKNAQIEFATLLGCKELESEVEASNAASIRVQEKAGCTLKRSGNKFIVRIKLN